MYDYKAKQMNVLQLNNYMLAKTLSMFEYESLPDTIPGVELERMLQTNGYAFITQVEGELYAFTGGLGGTPDVYGRPTEIVISNPALRFNKTLSLEKDGVLINGDSCRMGLMPLFNKHNTMLVENDINMVLHGYNTRMQKLITAPDDRTKASAEAYLKKSVDGELSVIGENAMFDGIKTHSGAAAGADSVSSMIEFNQYIKSSMFNEIGLAQNFNMKKERLVSAEIDQIRDAVFPFVYDMLKCRMKAIDKLNEMFGLKVEVDFGSVWNLNVKSFVDDVVGDVAPVSVDLPAEVAPSIEPVVEATPIVEATPVVEATSTSETTPVMEPVEPEDAKPSEPVEPVATSSDPVNPSPSESTNSPVSIHVAVDPEQVKLMDAQVEPPESPEVPTELEDSNKVEIKVEIELPSSSEVKLESEVKSVAIEEVVPTVEPSMSMEQKVDLMMEAFKQTLIQIVKS